MAQYRGISHPFRKGETSFPERAEDAELIRASIFQILSTQKGERVMRPSFGANVWRFIFANNNAFLEDLIRTEVRGAIARFEPRVTIQDITIIREEAEITIDIEYVVRSTQTLDRLEFTQPTPR